MGMPWEAVPDDRECRVFLPGARGKTPRADVLLIGHHPRDPVDSAAWIRATGARAVIFATEHECPVPEGTAVYRLRETGTLYLRMEERGVRIIPWRGMERRTG